MTRCIYLDKWFDEQSKTLDKEEKKQKKKLMADGEITLDEVLELAEDIKDIVEDLPSLSAIKKMKKAELIALANDNGLDVDGTKADLISRLEEAKQVIENEQ